MAGAICARPDPWWECRHLAARMRELDTDFRPLRVSKVDDPLERRDLRVCPDPHVLGRNAALGNNGRSFHDDTAHATRRKALSPPIVI